MAKSNAVGEEAARSVAHAMRQSEIASEAAIKAGTQANLAIIIAVVAVVIAIIFIVVAWRAYRKFRYVTARMIEVRAPCRR